MKDKKINIKKLNEDDILEIVLHYLNEKEFPEYPVGRGEIRGIPGKDLRFIGIFGETDYNDIWLSSYDLDEIDKNTDFNGSHSFLEKNPQFYLDNKGKT